MLVLEHTKIWKSKEGWSLAPLIFLTPSTVKFPTYDVCPHNMHESLCKTRIINLTIWDKFIKLLKNLSFILTREDK